MRIPKDYRALLTVEETERAIFELKTKFQKELSQSLNLRRLTAPIILERGLGINDDLNGVEKAVCFDVKDLGNKKLEIVQSLAKWKRLALKRHKIDNESGIYTDMNAIRPDETLDHIHSLYVDQWDWEIAIKTENRTIEYLKDIVERVYSSITKTERYISSLFPVVKSMLPNDIHFIHSEDLYELYPGLEPSKRERKIVKKYGAVFIIGIGGKLKDGQPHDHRAPDYDDWSTPTFNGYKGLNGDILVWNPVLNDAMELSSMGIRVSPESLKHQLSICGERKREELFFHQLLLNGELPYSIGGGIGQSRLCMQILRKAHIGEIQSCIWPEDMRSMCEAQNINLL